MGIMKTPGVYIVEKDAFPNSVVEVATAVPAFIGYTEKADNKGIPLTGKPTKITSIAEFHDYYGHGPKSTFEIEIKEEDSESESDSEPEYQPEPDFLHNNKKYFLNPTKQQYLLYRSMLLFFQNGGGPCYIVSIGGYKEDGSLDATQLLNGLIPLIKEQEPTMIVIPETVLLDPAQSASVQGAALMHCGDVMKNRIAILDIWEGYKDQKVPSGEGEEKGSCVANFRNAVGINHLKFAAAYYPWVNTSIVQDKELSYENIDSENRKSLAESLIEGLEIPDEDDKAAMTKREKQEAEINKIDPGSTEEFDKTQLNESLVAMNIPLYNSILKSIKKRLNLLPPAAAMAGIYTMVDNSRGVWKAPANVSLNSVVSPAVNITHYDQETLNVDVNGKSINAIRSFIGEGTLVWGARTLDGNSLDWRYINVRRTMIMLEESIRLASKAYVFEPNVANTWVTMKSMIRNFLTGIWKRGGLAGAVPDDAFSVHVGLGETMTAEDILEGILRITVLVAISRPAEFIEITFQQQMQKS